MVTAQRQAPQAQSPSKNRCAVVTNSQPEANITQKEEGHLVMLQNRLNDVAACLNSVNIAGPFKDIAAWFQHASRVKSILGNLNNPISFMACIMSRDFLVKNHGDEAKFDVADKSQRV